MIRELRTADFDDVIEVERAAGQVFRAVGMDAIADDSPGTSEELAAFLESGIAWVETDEHDRPIAYLLLERIDDRAHIEQVTVHPDFARKGLGARLIDRAGEWADAHNLDGLSLTTFATVPWNAPYYTRLGFRILPESEWTPGLAHRVAGEAAHGLDAWPRVVMIR